MKLLSTTGTSLSEVRVAAASLLSPSKKRLRGGVVRSATEDTSIILLKSEASRLG